MKAVILAAGMGTRMRPLTDGVPKPLLPVGGESLLERILRQCSEAGVDEAVLVVNYLKERVEAEVGGSCFGVDIEYVEQGEARGTGDAVSSAEGLVEEDFLVVNGDLYFEGDVLEGLVEVDGTGMAVEQVDNPGEYGAVELEGGEVVGLAEKSDDPPSDLINAGIYRFTPEVFDLLRDVGESERGEVELTDAVEAAGGVSAVEWDGFWLDVGYPWDLLEASERALEGLEGSIEGEVEEGATVKGGVRIGPGTKVKGGAYVEGPAWIGEGCEIGPNCYVRPNTYIGDGVKVGNGVEVKNSVVMEGGRAGHLSYVGDSLLGPDVNLGAGTVTANLRHDEEVVEAEVKGEIVETGRRKFGSVLGPGAKTGVNTSLNPGSILGSDGSTLPGEVVGGPEL